MLAGHLDFGMIFSVFTDIDYNSEKVKVKKLIKENES
jgi:hypothetical protein